MSEQLILRVNRVVFNWPSVRQFKMQCIPKCKILEHHPDTMFIIRKEFNMDKPGVIEDAIRILREWIEKQQHFKKKNFSDLYLEITIISCKGSIERAKKQMDRMCTLRTLLPQFFELRNPKTDFGNMFDILTPVALPKLTTDYHRVFLIKAGENVRLIKDYLHYFAFLIIVGDYLKIHDYCRGFIVIVDFTEMNVMDFLSNLNAVQIRQALTILIEGYGMRLKGLHIFTPSKLIDTFVTLLKQLVSQKIASRIHAYKSLENLTSIVPADILPKEYGGKERPLRSLLDEWLEILSSEENLNYLKDLSQAGTDESIRKTDKFNEEYAGMAGTFRVLTVD